MGKRVLIVEDDELVADHLAVLIRDRLGCVPIVTHSLKTALPLLDKVELGLLDVNVADGDVFPVASQLQERGVPFIFVSGSDPRLLPAELAGVPFLRKPVTENRLLAVARERL
jgi:DNA-binding response OmpR family regulator